MTKSKLLSRDDFREQVFARDNHKCIICGEEAKDAHHILERRLFFDGGYYIDNGASVCELHHLAAEMTTLSCEDVRAAAKITKILLPDHLYSDQVYDKWGNIVQPDGTRLPGELFHDESVQKILGAGNVLGLFSNRVKYPRTYHLPWSHGVTKDDRIMTDLSALENSLVVVTEKMDGENTTFYSDYIHARSINNNPHPSRSYVKSIHAEVCGDIPEGWRICGENLFGQKSIPYTNLAGYFLVFSIWNERNICLSWNETKEWASLLGLPTVDVLYEGFFDDKHIKSLYPSVRSEMLEGYVVRVSGEFHYREFRRSVGKFVRDNHIQTSHRWLSETLIPNKINEKNKRRNI